MPTTFTLQFTIPSSATSTDVTLPLTLSAAATYTVTWEDTGIPEPNILTHNYTSGGVKNVIVTLSSGSITGFGEVGDPINGWVGAQYLTDIDPVLPSTITSLAHAFAGATQFNSASVSGWGTSAVKTMNSMFYRATKFNRPLTTNGNIWNTSKVKSMNSMFYGANAFNQPIGNWDTSSVTDMQRMFEAADKFNKDISNWNTRRVTDMKYMFYYATKFSQDLGSWNIGAVTDMEGMLSYSGMSAWDYDHTLKGWAAQPLTKSVTLRVKKNVTLGAEGLSYTKYGKPARDILIKTYGWTITGDTLEDVPPDYGN